jgi:FkbM family methyltransferase
MMSKKLAHFLYYRLFSALFYAPFIAPLRGVVNRTPFLRVLHRLPVHGVFPVEGHGLSFRYCADSRDLIGRDIFWKGFETYEPETFAFLVPRIDQETLFIDVGANTGLFSLAASARDAAHVIAAEPLRRIFDCLSANITTNGRQSRTTLIAAALGSQDGEAVLSDPGGYVFPTSASLMEGGWRGMGGTEVTVPLKRLDSILASLDPELLENTRRIIVKIDVEGIEIDVLKGFSKCLADRDVQIIFEANDAEFLHTAREFLTTIGYKVFQITQDGLVPADAVVFSPGWNCRNFFAERCGQSRSRDCLAGEVRA